MANNKNKGNLLENLVVREAREELF